MARPPSTRIREKDDYRYVQKYSGLNAAIVVSDTPRGPVNKPVYIAGGDVAKYLDTFFVGRTIPYGSTQSCYQAEIYIRGGGAMWVTRSANAGSLFSGISINASTSQAIPDTSSLETYVKPVGEVIAFMANSAGRWGDRLKVALSLPATAEYAGQFNIAVYLDNALVESFRATRKRIKDGYGRSVYVGDVLVSSRYITAIDNPVVADTVVPPVVAAVSLAGGVDGTSSTAGQIMLAYDLYRNTKTYDITLLLDQGDSVPAVQLNLMQIAEIRTDAMAFISQPYAAALNPVSYVADMVDYRATETPVNNSYGAMFAPNVKVYDRYNDREMWVGPTAYAALAMNNAEQNYEMWYPIGGYTRGNLNETMDVQVHLEEDELGELYNAQVNPIRIDSGKDGGRIVIWGQKTMIFPPRLTDRLNVRAMLCYVKPKLKVFLDQFLFELLLDENDIRMRIRLDQFLADIKARNGIYGSYVVNDSSINTPLDISNHIKNVKIFMAPTSSLEYIDCDLILTDTGVKYV